MKTKPTEKEYIYHFAVSEEKNEGIVVLFSCVCITFLWQVITSRKSFNRKIETKSATKSAFAI